MQVQTNRKVKVPSVKYEEKRKDRVSEQMEIFETHGHKPRLLDLVEMMIKSLPTTAKRTKEVFKKVEELVERKSFRPSDLMLENLVFLHYNLSG